MLQQMNRFFVLAKSHKYTENSMNFHLGYLSRFISDSYFGFYTRHVFTFYKNPPVIFSSLVNGNKSFKCTPTVFLLDRSANTSHIGERRKDIGGCQIAGLVF